MHVLDCGVITVKDISLFSPGVDQGKSKQLANACYFIQHPKGNFLWDTGLDDNLLSQASGVSIADGMFHLQVNNGLEQQLNAIGFSVTDMDYVALSHFHFDHTGNINLFKNAKFLVQKNELQVAFSDQAEAMYFNPSSYNQIKKDQFYALSGDHDVFGDDTVKIISAAGHTPGHQLLLIKLKEYGSVLLSGDLYHFEKNRTHQRIPTVNFDKVESEKSMTMIESLLKNENAELWIQHDMENFNKTRKLAPFYK